MSKLIMLAGPSGSGKSTYAQKLVADFKKLDQWPALISSDTTREMLYGDASDQTDHQRVFDVCQVDIKNHLEMGRSVIFDATNLKAYFRAEPLNIALRAGAPCELHYMVTIAEICIRRQHERERKVPENVIVRQLNQRSDDLRRNMHDFYHEGFTTIKFIRNN